MEPQTEFQQQIKKPQREHQQSRDTPHLSKGGTEVQWLALSLHRKKVLSWNLLLCEEFTYSLHRYVGLPRVLRFPPTVQLNLYNYITLIKIKKYQKKYTYVTLIKKSNKKYIK